MIPVADVESAVRSHPAVADVALVGHPDGKGAGRPPPWLSPWLSPAGSRSRWQTCASISTR
jgi:hypothetical protein